MKMSKLVGRRIKEDPKDAKTVSHKFLIRPGVGGNLFAAADGGADRQKD